MTIRQLEYAVAVGDLLSFRRAATRCHVSQPSLSAQIALLEEHLGVRLFERDRRRVLVTPAGQRLLAHARRVLREAFDLREAAKQQSDPLSGTLRIGVIPTIAPYLLPALAPALRNTYPRLTLLWREDKTDALARALDEGSLDAALVALEAELGDVDHQLVAVDEFVLATKKGDALGRKAGAATPADLRGQNVLLLDDGHCFRDQALAFCAKAKARELEFRATSLTTLAQMVASGAGVTLLPRLAISTEAARAELQVRAFGKPSPHRTIALVWRKRSPIAMSLRQLAATIQATARRRTSA